VLKTRGKIMLVKGLCIFCVSLVLGLLLLDHYYPIPRQRSFSTVVLADQGEVLRAFSNARQQWRYPIDNSQVAENYLTLLLGYEDRWFYQHFGVNPLAIVRASWQNFSSNKIVSGGSTLTMQVARLLAPHSRSLGGKVHQVLRALQLEWHYSKAEILNLYLNLAPFGGTIIGVQAASMSYFDKPLDQISDAEAALLAVLPQAPSRWRPDRHPEAAKQARDKVLKRMLALNIWSKKRVADAIQEPIFSLSQKSPLLAPLLARRLKKACQKCEKIQTLINIEMQRLLAALVDDYSSQLATGLSTAVMVMENSSGAVRSYIGSAKFLDTQRFGHVDMIQAVRSPGSTLKPFLYGLAMDQGLLHSQSLLQDAPRYNKAYRPLNFSGGFNGPVSVTQALQRSLNIPAVQVLESLEPEFFAARLQFAGLKLIGAGAKKPNISMVLGGVGTKLEYLVAAYSALARSGITIKPRLTKKQKKVERYLLSPGAAWITWKMLAINPQKIGRRQRVENNWPLAWKTGTSYGYREAWAMGVTKKWTIGVWVGRPDSSSSPGISGRHTAAPLLFKVFKSIANRQLLKKPDSVQLATICWPLGSSEEHLDNRKNNCHERREAWILNDTYPATLSEHALLKTFWYNAQGERVEPSCDGGELLKENKAVWPVSLEPWIPHKWRRSAQLTAISLGCSGIMAEQQAISITSIPEQSIYHFNPRGADHALSLNLLASSAGGSGIKSWYLNGKYLGARRARRGLNFTLKKRGKYQLSVVDEHGNLDIVTFYTQ